MPKELHDHTQVVTSSNNQTSCRQTVVPELPSFCIDEPTRMPTNVGIVLIGLR